MTDPLVTIGVITYNQEDYIAETMDSLLAQEYRPLQIIVCDDCSKDGTANILHQYQERYPDIIELHVHPKNVGICENMISFFPHIRGKYFCWIGGDDYLLPGKVNEQVSMMLANPEWVMSYHDTQVFNENGLLYTYNDLVLGQQPFAGNITRDLIQRRCFISALSMMVDMDQIGDLKPKTVSICADWLFFIETSMLGPVGFLPQILGAYRRHPANITNKINVNLEENVYIYLAQHYPTLKREINKGQAWSYINYFVKYMLIKDWKNAGSILRKTLALMVRQPSSALCAMAYLTQRSIARIKLFLKTGSMLR